VPTHIVALDKHPYDTWDKGLAALSDAIADRQRLPAVLGRLERMAERQGVTAEDLYALLLTTPPSAPKEPEAAEPPGPRAAAPERRQGPDAVRITPGASRP
jgi:hypothetical protein